MNDLQTIARVIAVILVVVYCIMPMALFALTVWLVRHYLNRLTDPDVEHLHRHYQRLRAMHPTTDPDELVRTVIRRQSVRCGVVGALTGIGGFVTLPIALPVDILVSMRLQATTVQFIAETYGHSAPSSMELEVRRYLIMSGGASVTRRTSGLILEFLIRFAERSLAKFIPLLGALVGFAVNYTIAQGGATVAQKWYAGQIALAGHAPPPKTLLPGDYKKDITKG